MTKLDNWIKKNYEKNDECVYFNYVLMKFFKSLYV